MTTTPPGTPAQIVAKVIVLLFKLTPPGDHRYYLENVQWSDARAFAMKHSPLKRENDGP